MIENVNVGILSIGSYVPEEIHDFNYISEQSGIPAEVVRDKFGIKQVHKAGPDESVSDMGTKAALKALEAAGLSPLDIDMVVYCGSEYKDYYLYNCAAQIKYNIKADNAESFEIHNLCSAGVYSLKVLKSMMITDERLQKVLVVSSSKEGDLINYKDSDSRFMFNFGDGAAAWILERNLGRNVILETAMISDGQFAADVSTPGIGCVNFGNFDNMPKEDRYLRVRDVKDMKRRLDPITLGYFYKVMDLAVERSGYKPADVGFLAPIHMKKSMLMGILEHFELTEDKTFLLVDYGHVQSADCFISMLEGSKCGRLQDGDIVVTVSAGTGYTWASTVIKWGPL